jgi:hypothetical protein
MEGASAWTWKGRRAACLGTGGRVVRHSCRAYRITARPKSSPTSLLVACLYGSAKRPRGARHVSQVKNTVLVHQIEGERKINSHVEKGVLTVVRARQARGAASAARATGFPGGDVAAAAVVVVGGSVY